MRAPTPRRWWWLASQGMITLGMGMIVFSGIMSPDGLNRGEILTLVFASLGFVTNLITLRRWDRNQEVRRWLE